jgi:hypothetical protein
MFSKLHWVRGRTPTPHPIEIVALSAQPSPARGEGAITATSLVARCQARMICSLTTQRVGSGFSPR